jgi:hypothetical protein
MVIAIAGGVTSDTCSPAEAYNPAPVTYHPSRITHFVDWEHFTPWTSLLGGGAIGIAAALLMLLNGRVAGVSGIIGGLLAPARGDTAWRVLFIAGLFAAPSFYQLVRQVPVPTIEASHAVVALAGLLVGVGTRYGAGCTSGHGVCGLGRLSPRSLVATLSFMIAGFATVFVVRHLIS